MASTAIQRLESLLQHRKLDHTLAGESRPETRVLPTDLGLFDVRLRGGWPYGEVSEIVGPRSSGRTSLLVATLRAATRRGGVVALVDAFDRFDPVTASDAGLDLARVLWVRGPALTMEGRRPRCADRAVVNAVRALDLIVRAGGFAVAALDLGDVPARAIRGLPFTTWLRLAHANEGHQTVCLLMADAPISRSARGVSLHLESNRSWVGHSPQQRRFGGFSVLLSA